MIKNAIILILMGLVIGEGVFIAKKMITKPVVAGIQTDVRPTAAAPRPQFLTKGMKLADSSVSKYAYKIAPGELSEEAKNALTGFGITTKNATDGSILVSLIPKDSDDQSQQYTVRKGYALYFVEMSMGDDQDNVDKNLRDDYGVIVDSEGIVQ